MSQINVCLSSDNNYAKHAGVVIASILYNAASDDNLVFYVLDGGINTEVKKDFDKLKQIKECEINFIQIDEKMFEDYKKIKTHFYISLASFYRLKMASLLPKVDRIIYFDCDFVICTSLKDLYNTDMENKPIAGVLDTDKRKTKKNPSYINSGLVLFDLKKIREENIEDKFLKYAIENSSTITIGDQEILNEVLKGNIKILEDEWNVQSSNFINRSSYTKHPKAIHMLAKPWVYASNCIHKKEYYKYLQMTPWALNEQDYKHWTVDNERASIIDYVKRRPLFFLRPRFYEALFKTYILK